MSNSTLPVELIQEIIRSLVAPTNPLRYNNGSGVVHTLQQLCLVNRFVHDISTSLLYSSIELTNEHQLMKLISTLKSSPVIRGRIHSLFLNSFFVAFSLITEARELLDLLSPHLRRLALCVPGSMIKRQSSLRPVLGRLTCLEDFIHIGYPCADLGDIWTDWKSLRRVLVVGPQVNKTFLDVIKSLPRLVHLWLIDACWGEWFHDHSVILDLLKAGSGLQKVVLVFGSSVELSEFLQFVRNLPVEVLQSSIKEGLDLQYLELQITLNALRTQVADGSLWELNTQNIVGTVQTAL
jgi:hypothetical protein